MKLQDAVVFTVALPILAPVAVIRTTYGLLKYMFKSKAYSALPAADGIFPMVSLFKPGRLEEVFLKMRNEDGEFPDLFSFGFYYNSDCAVAVCSADLVRHIYTNPNDFPKLPVSNRLLESFVGEGIVTSEGHKWKRDRKMLTPVFHFDSLTKGTPKIVRECLKLYGELDGRADHSGQVDSDALELFARLTMRIIIAYAFGDDMPAEPMNKAFEELFQPVEELFLYSFLFGPLWKLLPLSAAAQVRKAKVTIRKLVEERVMHALERKKRGESLFDDNNLLEGILLAAKEGEEKETVEEAISQGLTFLFAGHDTTSKLLSFTMDYLTRPENVHYQAELRQEAEVVFGDIEGFARADRSAVNKLVLCERVLLETLRLSPVAPILERQAAKDVRLGNTLIKAGTAVISPVYCTHRDGRYWKEPDTFYPHRFSDENSVGRKNFSFLPFGAGGRTCLGQKLSLLEARLILSSLLLKYDIVRLQEEAPKRVFAFVMAPTPFKVGLRRRDIE
uniref:Cytochrome P450 n=1 Tax=Palpitomonas bilix TaxID=652834 RepID=A0A7S3D4F7_9EUKA|mmetsp:Transcript_20963/g.54133  ORF Transcript_20963/g.54133 Transcript_20963/m.54133 type:complete len:504 (+) Transcript_20963:181-1692(+)